MNISNIIYVIKKLIKRRRIFLDFLYDYYRFELYSSTGRKSDDKIKFEKLITKKYHVIEKGLALPKVKPGFGQPKIIDLIEDSNKYIKKYGVNQITFITINVINSYLIFHKNHYSQKLERIANAFANFCKEHDLQPDINIGGGYREIAKQDVLKHSMINYESFVRSRYSVRNFSQESIPEELILKALEISSYTPSVCNRQGWLIHLYNKPELIKTALENQNGNKGFSTVIKSLILICGDLRAFISNERNQFYVDCGMYSMNLVFALHSQGLGTCVLNNSFTKEQDQKIRDDLNLKSYETPILMIAVGQLKEKFRVAYSYKDNYKKFTSFNI